jgi:hypothetical protein
LRPSRRRRSNEKCDEEDDSIDVLCQREFGSDADDSKERVYRDRQDEWYIYYRDDSSSSQDDDITDARQKYHYIDETKLANKRSSTPIFSGIYLMSISTPAP